MPGGVALSLPAAPRPVETSVANAGVWEMETFGTRWNEHAVGLLDVHVASDLRRQGLGKFLIAMLLRHLHEQFFSLVEIQIPADRAPALGLFQKLGFAPVDTGWRYRRISN